MKITILILSALLMSACRAGTVPVHAVQGADDTSPFAGRVVNLAPVVVTAVGGRGYFVQSPAARADQDANTSEGLYVFTGRSPRVRAGQRIRLAGRVKEFHGHTQLVEPRSLEILGVVSLPEAVMVPRRGANLEALESMRIRLPLATVTGPSDAHGEALVVPGGERLFRRQAQADETMTRLELDPDALGLNDRLLAAPRRFSAAGVLVYRYGDYVLWPAALELGPAPALPLQVRATRPGEIAVASFNLKLFYDERRVAGEPVVSAREFEIRLDKLAAWLDRVLQCPHIVAVQEVEARDVLQRLAGASGCGYRAYADNDWRDMPGLGFLVRAGALPAVRTDTWGEDLRLSTEKGVLFDRPPLVLRVGLDKPLTIINVHLRSMRGLGEEPWVVQKRREQALKLRELIEQLHAQGARRILVLGDFNAFPFDDGYADVLGIVTNHTLTNLLSRLPAEQRYSYVYQGRAQALDHALVSGGLEPLVSGFAYARGNADAPVNLAHQAGSLFRASDHDPLVVYLRYTESSN